MKRSNLQNFQIIQRNKDGFADFRYEGKVAGELNDDDQIIVRVVRENDNLTVIPWRECKLERSGGWTAWSTDLCLPEGGLYRVEASHKTIDRSPERSNKVDCAYHVGVGDIYVMAGQSNMTGYGRDNAFDPPALGVHAFTRAGEWAIASHPLGDSLDSPYGYAEDHTGTSPALSFARRLSNSLGVPVGLVPAAVGASSLSQWDLNENGKFYTRMRAYVKDAGAFRGMIWFQGCSEALDDLADTYLNHFTHIVTQFRADYGDFPILTVQLNRHVKESEKLDRNYGIVRNAQRLAALTIPDVYVIPSLDLPVSDGIHDSSSANVTIGERLANLALAEIYHKNGQTAAMVLSAEKADDTHVKVNLTPGHRVIAMDGYPLGMNVEDENGLIECLRAVPGPDCLIVETERPFGENARFHYAWRSRPSAFPARDADGMPLLACYGVEIK